MPVTIDRSDVLRRMARVKSWSRNGDILELLDVLEHLLVTANLSRDTGELSRDNASPSRDNLASVAARLRVKPSECPECAARRASDLARQRRKRDRAKGDAQCMGNAAN